MGLGEKKVSEKCGYCLDSLQLKELQKSTVKIKNPEKVADIINMLVKGGSEKLQIISDFDMTLTKQHENGKKCATSHGIFSSCKHLPDHYKENTDALFYHYHAIEIDPTMSVEEKIPHMYDWYRKGHELLIDCDFMLQDIARAVEDVNSPLRDGTNELLIALQEANVPVLVFSAGIGDVVEAILKSHNAMLDNTKVISNYLKFGDDGKLLSGYKNDLIHMFNKNEEALKSNSYFQELASRNNVIVLGDTIGDSNMAEGVPNLNAILKIGFLYGNIDERLPEFLDTFDIVLVDDQSMDVVRDLVRLILE